MTDGKGDEAVAPSRAAWVGYLVLGAAVSTGIVWGLLSIAKALRDPPGENNRKTGEPPTAQV